MTYINQAKKQRNYSNPAPPKLPTQKNKAPNDHDAKPKSKIALIFSPPIPASHTLEETRHRLIRTSNLDLEKRRLIAITPISRTLRAALLRIIPSSRTTKDVLLLFALKDAPRVNRFGNGMLEGTGAAFETVGALVCEGDGEDVGALGADFGKS